MHVLAYIVSLLRIGQIRTHQQLMSIHFMCINFLQTLNITCETFRQFQSRHTRLLKILAVPAGNPEGRTEGRKEGRKGENQIPFPSFPLTHRRPPALCRNYDAETRREGGDRDAGRCQSCSFGRRWVRPSIPSLHVHGHGGGRGGTHSRIPR